MERFGNGKRNIVFLHGGCVRYRSYLPLIQELAKENTVYAFDLPGHGDSISTDSVEKAIDYVEKQISELNLEEVSIIGHSYGGFCGYKVATRITGVKNVVLIDPLITIPTESKLELTYILFIKKNLRAMKIHKNLNEFYRLGVIDIFSNIFMQKLNIFKTAKLLFRVGDLEKVSDLQRFANKNLVIISGKDDSIIDFEQLSNTYGNRVIPVDGEHDWLMEDVVETTRIIEKYLAFD